jgi:O-antigen ligase
MESAGLLVIYFFSKQIFLGEQPRYRQYIVLILLLGLSQIGIAVFQWFEYLPSYNSNFRISGIFFNPSPFIIFLSAIVIYGLTAGLYSTNHVIRIAGIVLFVASIPIVLIILSRSAWLGLIAGVLLVFTIRFQLLKKASGSFRHVFTKIIGATVLLVIISFSIYYLYHLKKESADGRKLVWKLSTHIIADHPFNGIGQDRFSARIIEYQSAYFKQYPEKMLTEGRLTDTVYYAFNDVLQITVEQGIVGLILFCFVLLTAVKFSKRLLNDTPVNKITTNHGAPVGAMASILIILVSGLTSYPLVMLPIGILFFSAMGILSAGYANTIVTPLDKPTTKTLTIVYIIGGIGFVMYSVALCHAYYLANNMAKNGYDSESKATDQLTGYAPLINTEEWYVLRQCDYLLNNEQYAMAIIEMEKAKQFTANKALYFSLAELYSYKKKYDKAEEQLKVMYYALPGLIAPKYRLAKLYYDAHQKAKWESAAEELLNFKPKVLSSTGLEMMNEIRQLNTPSSLATMESNDRLILQKSKKP